MNKPTIAQKSPIPVEVEEGRSYFWCSCGRSSNQPFCDGSHKETGFQPLKWIADGSGRKFFCGCKMSDGKPFCDGTHNSL